MELQDPIRDWDDAERWLLEHARWCVRRRCVPDTMAFTFHAGRMSMVVGTPALCEEDADAVVDVFCRTLPTVEADQILVMFPGAYQLDEHSDTPTFALRALLGVRGEGWRHLVHLLPFDRPEDDIEVFEFEPADPWSPRIRAVFDPATADLPPVATTPPADGDVVIAIPPDSPLERVGVAPDRA